MYLLCCIVLQATGFNYRTNLFSFREPLHAHFAKISTSFSATSLPIRDIYTREILTKITFTVIDSTPAWDKDVIIKWNTIQLAHYSGAKRGEGVGAVAADIHLASLSKVSIIWTFSIEKQLGDTK